MANNAKAMREALEAIANEIRTWRSSVVGITPGERRLLNVARAALSAPPRNCDRFRTAKDAETAFDAMCAQKRIGKCIPLGCPVPSHTGAESCEVAWLFAPAGEAEGKKDDKED